MILSRKERAMTKEFGNFEAPNAPTTAAADQTHHNLLSDTVSHVKNTWKDVLSFDASGAECLEAAGEVAAAGALAYGAIRGGSGLTELLKGGSGAELASGKDLLGAAAPDLAPGREAISKIAPDLNEEQLTKMATDLKLFPAAGHEVDPIDAHRAIAAIVRSSPDLNVPESVGYLRGVESGYQTLGQHEKAVEIIDHAIDRSKGLPNRLSFGVLPQAQHIEPLFYLDKSESLAALGRDGEATKALNKFANSWGAEKLTEKFPGLPDKDAAKLVEGVVPKFDLASVQNGGRIFDDISKSIEAINVPKELIKPAPQRSVEDIWRDVWNEKY
jgi:hypothetical protein